jgi:hypothetical protein
MLTFQVAAPKTACHNLGRVSHGPIANAAEAPISGAGVLSAGTTPIH